MVESAAFPGGYFGNTFRAPDESEGSGSSAQIDTEVTASENSSTPARKCIKLNSNDEDPYGVQRQVISLYSMSQSERKDLIRRLKLELEQTKIALENAELQRLNTASVSSISDRVGFNSAQKLSSRVSSSKKPSDFAMGPGKNVRHQTGTASRGWNRGSSGKFESSSKESIPSAPNVTLMKQCDTLLKKLWSHPHAWVFQAPVDVVKLNIPDYLTIIKHPMDLGTIKKNLASGVYSSPHEFAADVRLTFTNAMTYNPSGHDVHIMGDILSKLFEARWKTIEKKLPASACSMQTLPAMEPHDDRKTTVCVPPTKKRKMASPVRESVPEPVKPVMTAEERHRLGRQLESLLEELPAQIIEFLKKHSSNGGEIAEDEIEIDIDVLSDEVLLTLQKLLNEYIQDKEAKHSNVEPCEIELLNGSGPSNSLLHRGNEMADEYVGGNEPPISRSSSDSESGSSEDQCDDAKPMIQESASKITTNSEAQRDEDTRIDDLLDGNQSTGAPEQMDISGQQKLSSEESDGQPDGNISETPASSEKQYRAALLKNKFADIILKAREKTLPQNSNKGDPEKLRKEREEFELQKKKERARLQAEAEAAEDARRQAEAEAAAEAAAEAKRKREVEREAARQALLQMEKTVEINENSRFLEDLEMLSSSAPEQLLGSADEVSPERPLLDALGSFNLRGINPLEQLGLYMKQDDDEEEPEAPPALPNLATFVEEGEID